MNRPPKVDPSGRINWTAIAAKPAARPQGTRRKVALIAVLSWLCGAAMINQWNGRDAADLAPAKRWELMDGASPAQRQALLQAHYAEAEKLILRLHVISEGGTGDAAHARAFLANLSRLAQPERSR